MTGTQLTGAMPDPHILIVRHAQSAANAGVQTTNPATIPITDTGVLQARRVAGVVVNRPALIVVSPYLRTRQTAAPLVDRYPAAPMEEWPIEEFTYLDIIACAGTTFAERETFRDTYWSNCDPLRSNGPGCESFAEFIARVRRFVAALSARVAGGEHIVVFTHGMLMQAMIWLQQNTGAEEGRVAMAAYDRVRISVRVPNCAILRGAVDRHGKLRLDATPAVDHLPADLRTG